MTFLVADVVDKGVGAALYMALSWALIRTYAIEYPGQPEQVFNAVNRRLLSDTRSDQFVTVFYGVLEPATGWLVYCNAGHPPPYLFRSHNNSDVLTLTRTGMPLGVLEEARWDRKELRLDPGDVLVLYTDGITDAQNVHEESFDKERMIGSVQAVLGRPAQEIQDALLQDVQEFAGRTPQGDDIALMVWTRDPPFEQLTDYGMMAA